LIKLAFLQWQAAIAESTPLFLHGFEDNIEEFAVRIKKTGSVTYYEGRLFYRLFECQLLYITPGSRPMYRSCSWNNLPVLGTNIFVATVV